MSECDDIIREKENPNEEEDVLSPADNRLNITSNYHQNYNSLKKLNTASQLIRNQPEDYFQFGKPHQSCIFGGKEGSSAAKSVRRGCKLEDFGRSLDKTRFVQKYQFYHNQEAIKSYTQEHPKIEREFGDELVNIPEFSLALNPTKSIDKSHTSRSNLSSEFAHQPHRFSEEELRQRIDAHL